MDALMDNKKLTCRGCHNYLEPPLQVCSNDYAHLLCGKCKGKYDECVICNGKISVLSERIQETFLAQKYPCKYHIHGCNTMLALHEKSDHEYECNYKIFKCEYGRFCTNPCEWEGPYSEIERHFREQHVKFPFSKTPPLSIKLRIPGRSFNFIQMIKAYNELFWFKYRIDSEKQKVFFVLQLIGTKKQASEFSYEMEFISLIDPNNVIHFTEKCFSDCENISTIFESEQCAVTSFLKIQNFIVDNKLTFTYNIKKKNKFNKNPNLPANTEEDQKQEKSKKNHNPRHNQRRNRGNKDNSRDHSSGSNVSKKGQKNQSNNFQSVFTDQSSEALRNLQPPAYQVTDPPPTYQAATVSQSKNYQPKKNETTNQDRTNISGGQIPLSQTPSTSSTQLNYSKYNANQPSNVPTAPVYQNRVGTPTGYTQSPSTSTRQPNYSNYNPNQSAQYRKAKKEDNCVIS